MRIPAVKLLLLPLVLGLTASRLSAAGEHSPRDAKPETKKRIVVASPEKEVVVDGDRVFVWNENEGDSEFPDPDLLSDFPELDEGDLPRVVHFHGARSGGYLGVRSIDLTPELRQHFGAPRDAGVLVGTVETESPAAKGGVQVGDVITAVDGQGVGSTGELSRSIRRHKNGETVKLDLLRDRAKKSLPITVVERKDEGLHLGDLGHGLQAFHWRDWNLDGPAVAPVAPIAPVPPVPPVPPIPTIPPAPGVYRRDGLSDRIDSLEQRLKDLESRLPK